MKLTRRDALAALAGAGIVVGGGAAAVARDDPAAGEAGQSPGDDRTLATLVGTAEVVYPSAVEGVEAFVETYALGRIENREAYRTGVEAAVGELDETARLWNGDFYAALPVTEREDLLRQLGVHTAEPDPDGTIAERVRYFVVNELLYALYTSPTGGELVGIENPQGHPGGTESYQRGPQ